MTRLATWRSVLLNGPLFAIFLCLHCASYADAPSLALNNRSPYIAQFVAPSTITDALLPDRNEYRYSIDISSHSTQMQDAATYLELDGESWRASVSVRRKLNPNWIVGIELPLWHHTGGGLDRVIDRWHKLTGLPDGEREQQPRDNLNFLYSDSLASSQFTQQQTALGDIQLTAARLLNSNSRTSNWLQFTTKLATGEVKKFSGSGASDVAIQFNHHRHSNWYLRPMNWLMTATAMHTGQSEHVIDNQHRQQYRFSSQWTWAWRDSVQPQLQLRWRSAAYDSQIPALGKSSVGLDAGVLFQARHGSWQVGICEDIKIDSAPDITLYAQFSRR